MIAPEQKVLILDFGSQYTQLIARRVRELKVYCEIHPFSTSLAAIRAFAPRAVILSGGPSSVWEAGAPISDPGVLDLGVPILGICYGMQLMAQLLGGEVVKAGEREYGHVSVTIGDGSDLFHGLGSEGTSVPVWMSHGDRVSRTPPGFGSIARSANSPVAAMRAADRPLFGVQFHPEVHHTPAGKEILANFLFRVSRCEPTWTMASFIEVATSAIREKVGADRAICGLSGGVDSSVAAALVHRAIGDRLTCIFVDNGLLRKGEAEEVRQLFGNHFQMDLRVNDASERFLKRLAHVADPEKKRTIIGNVFIRVFEEEASRIEGARYLVQGTLYPDVIESVSFKGPSATIKKHHNVGGLPKRMGLSLIEPLRELFKDEVRALGRELGLAEVVVGRHPFPGPGLAVRILGPVAKARIEVLRNADSILMEEIRKAGLYDSTWQAFAVLLPVKSVGVMGDERTYENVVVVRAVESQDGMTADWARLPYELLARLSNRIINEVRGVNRVVYDVSSKPPSTIEWE